MKLKLFVAENWPNIGILVCAIRIRDSEWRERDPNQRGDCGEADHSIGFHDPVNALQAPLAYCTLARVAQIILLALAMRRISTMFDQRVLGVHETNETTIASR